jgi:hypothetical protein
MRRFPGSPHSQVLLTGVLALLYPVSLSSSSQQFPCFFAASHVPRTRQALLLSLLSNPSLQLGLHCIEIQPPNWLCDLLSRSLLSLSSPLSPMHLPRGPSRCG